MNGISEGGEMSETKEYSIPELVKRIAEEAPLFFSNIGKDWVFSQGEYEEFIDSLLQSHRPSVTRDEVEECFFIPTWTQKNINDTQVNRFIQLFKSKGVTVKGE